MPVQESKLTLDKSKHFGVVFPPEDDAHYHQDGFYFDRKGALVASLMDDEAKTRLKRMNAKAIARAQYRESLVKSLVEEGVAAEEAERIAEQDTSPDAVSDIEKEGDKVDLVRWAKGTRKYLWAEVVKAAKEEFGFGATSKASLATFLVEEKQLLAPEDVRI